MKGQTFARVINAQGETVVELIGPGRSEDLLSECLRILTHQLTLKDSTLPRGGGFFGGKYGYGVEFENDTLMMHPYCWCEKPSCLWCMIWLSNVESCTEEAAKTHRDIHVELIRSLYGNAAAEYHNGAPHFWHKPSGLQVWWYKYIGRDNHVVAGNSTLQELMASCLASIGAPGLAEAAEAYFKAVTNVPTT